MKSIERGIPLLFVLLLLGSLGVHMTDPEFAGKLTQEDTSHLVERGKALYKEKGCLGCHGDHGQNPTDEKFPKIGNQSRFYTENQIKDIRDGIRKNGGSSMMKASIRDLTDEQAYLISFYLED